MVWNTQKLERDFKWHSFLAAFVWWCWILVGQSHKYNNQYDTCKQEHKMWLQELQIVLSSSISNHFRMFWISCVHVSPITPRVPSRMPTVDWIVGMPWSCFGAVLQFPLTLHGQTVTVRETTTIELFLNALEGQWLHTNIGHIYGALGEGDWIGEVSWETSMRVTQDETVTGKERGAMHLWPCHASLETVWTGCFKRESIKPMNVNVWPSRHKNTQLWFSTFLTQI